jgi:hypothetical protein
MTATLNTSVQKSEMAAVSGSSDTRLAGLTAFGGAIIMIVGAALYFSSGTDLWAAVDKSNMVGYLTAAGAVKVQLVANLCFWIVGVLVLGTAWHFIIPLCVQRPVLARIAGVCAAAAVPLVIVSYLMMLALVVQIAPDTSDTSVNIANVVGWIGIRADDLATALLIGFAPFLISLAARGEWMPKWLVVWGYLAGIVGLFSLVVLYIPGMSEAGFLIVPVGVGWMLALGIVLLRR